MGQWFDSLDAQQKSLIEKHLDLVIQANEKVNLTRIQERDEALLLHVEDSLTALDELNDSPSGLYGDLGSGAGYPGIPLAIASGRNTVLVDARQKKMEMVAAIVEELGLAGQIETYAGRAELLARRSSQSFSVLTARALSRLSVLLELASPLLKKGGRLICYKAHVDEDELSDAERVKELVGMELVSQRSFALGDCARQIIVYEKMTKPKVKLPRLEGQAQKNPL